MKRYISILLITAMLCVAGCGPSTDADGIVMPKASENYEGAEWTLETLEDQLRGLGFSNFEERPFAPNDENYMDNISKVEAKPGLFLEKPWNAGDKLDASTTIVIEYNESPMLTPENNPDLKAMVECADDYETFAQQYDGRYVSFDAIVSFQYTSPTLDDIIMVSGGDYQTNQSRDQTIYIGEESWPPLATVNARIPVGTPVHVEGRVELDWSRYHDQLFVQAYVLQALDDASRAANE